MTKDEQLAAFKAEILAAVPESDRAAIQTALDNQAVATRLRDGVLRQSDYSRAQDQLRADREALDARVNEAATRIEGWNEWYKQVSAETEALKAQTAAYEEAYGPLEGAERRHPSLSREDVAKLVSDQLARDGQQFMNQHLGLTDMLVDIKFDFKDKFGETLPTKEFLDFVKTSGLPPQIAYREYIAPRVEEQNKKAFSEQLKKAKEEGAREALSSHKLPVMPTTTEAHPVDLMGAKDRPKTQGDRINAALATFNETLSARN